LKTLIKEYKKLEDFSNKINDHSKKEKLNIIIEEQSFHLEKIVRNLEKSLQILKDNT
jgi:hypothetical protein